MNGLSWRIFPHKYNVCCSDVVVALHFAYDVELGGSLQLFGVGAFASIPYTFTIYFTHRIRLLNVVGIWLSICQAL